MNDGEGSRTDPDLYNSGESGFSYETGAEEGDYETYDIEVSEHRMGGWS
ncbi:MAG: hypothetical protein ABEJ24_04620 [Candidatus Magasanikbacteria bacterium]